MKKIHFSFKMTLFCIAACFALLFTECKNNKSKQESNSNDSLTGTINISGAFALYPMTTKWSDEFRKIHPNVKINISGGGAGKGMVDALSGMVDFGMFSRDVKKEEIEKGCWEINVTKDAVLSTINSKNPIINELKSKGLTKEIFYKIFISGEITDWGSAIGNKNVKNKINIYTRSDACGAAQKWAEFLGKNQEDLLGIGVNADPGVAGAVKKDVYAIGYNNKIYIYDIQTNKKYEGLEVIPIDINENGIIDEEENFYDSADEIAAAIKSGKYPSPPARRLSFVSNGKPQNKVAIKFLQWILTDGQKYVGESGYIKLPEDEIKLELEKLTIK
ncbi:MAG: PstS family phosphate ABC transporter substrate-binding protein [Bacteroidales bacterium]|nr:PstS family phosphate ABC transporter substrate-binding protein [Bacteroidales bacterium]